MMIPDFYLKVKKLSKDAYIYTPAMEGDAGFDVCATESIFLEPNERYTMPLGLGIEFPNGYVCIINQKSGLSKKYGLDTIGNVIDSSYRGEIHVTLVNTGNSGVHIEKGQKICQLIFFVHATTKNIEYVDSLSETDRGNKGFGSSGV